MSLVPRRRAPNAAEPVEPGRERASAERPPPSPEPALERAADRAATAPAGLGHDFGRIRIHADDRAAAAARGPGLP